MIIRVNTILQTKGARFRVDEIVIAQDPVEETFETVLTLTNMDSSGTVSESTFSTITNGILKGRIQIIIY